MIFRKKYSPYKVYEIMGINQDNDFKYIMAHTCIKMKGNFIDGDSLALFYDQLHNGEYTPFSIYYSDTSVQSKQCRDIIKQKLCGISRIDIYQSNDVVFRDLLYEFNLGIRSNAKYKIRTTWPTLIFTFSDNEKMGFCNLNCGYSGTGPTATCEILKSIVIPVNQNIIYEYPMISIINKNDYWKLQYGIDERTEKVQIKGMKK